MKTQRQSLWRRAGNRLRQIDEALNYNYAMYTSERLDVLQGRVAQLEQRIEEIETASQTSERQEAR